jgi:hypothetical protein
MDLGLEVLGIKVTPDRAECEPHCKELGFGGGRIWS